MRNPIRSTKPPIVVICTYVGVKGSWYNPLPAALAACIKELYVLVLKEILPNMNFNFRTQMESFKSPINFINPTINQHRKNINSH
jgi:hypothetical protein